MIQQKIKTLSIVEGNNMVEGTKFVNLKAEMNLDNFVFRHWYFDPFKAWRGDAWVAEKILPADNATEALNSFRKELSQIVPKLCFVSQCSMDFESQSFIVIKQENNPEKIFLGRYTYEEESSGLLFGAEEIKSYEQLKQYQNQSIFRYLQECNNVPTYFPKLSLLFPALEAMAGKVEVQKTKDDGTIEITYKYDKSVLIKILGSELFNNVFGPNGLRHRFFHGEFNFEIDQDYVEKIYTAVVSYFNNNFKTQIPQDVVSPQRNFSHNYYETKFWAKPLNIGQEISIQILESNFDESRKNNKDMSLFEMVYNDTHKEFFKTY